MKENPDLDGYVKNDVDIKFEEAFGDYLHENPGTHLSGGIEDDKMWKDFWKILVSLPVSRYLLPSKSGGKPFIDQLSREVKGIIERKWNSEKMLVFCSVILQRAKDIKGSGPVRQRIKTRLEWWSQGRFKMLVEDTVRAAHALARKKIITTVRNQQIQNI